MLIWIGFVLIYLGLFGYIVASAPRCKDCNHTVYKHEVAQEYPLKVGACLKCTCKRYVH